MEEKLREVLDVAGAHPEACDLKLSLLASAILSGKPEMCIKPYPPQFVDEHKDLQLDRLQEIVRQVPPLQRLHSLSTAKELPETVIDLLHWALIREPELRPVASPDYPDHLRRSLCKKPTSQWPQYVFQVLSSAESHAERKFQQHKSGVQTNFAYHGSRVESFFSILNYGLAQHLCKRDLYGEGAYLSTDMDVALSFSPQGLAWEGSPALGAHYSCLALCEYVPNPLFIRNNPKKVPVSYVVLTNNEIVRVRYLLIFTKRRRRQPPGQPSSEPGLLFSSTTVISVIFYISLLALIGFFGSDRGNVMRQKVSEQLWSLWDQLFYSSTKNK